MNTHEEILAACRIEAQRLGGALWRNNSGAFQDARGRWVRYGLGNDSAALCRHWKSPDLVGIAPAWPGAPGGRLWGVEIKPAGWRYRGDEHERAQAACHANIRALGGIADFVSDIRQLREMLDDKNYLDR
jgi:hypothetical protein